MEEGQNVALSRTREIGGGATARCGVRGGSDAGAERAIEEPPLRFTGGGARGSLAAWYRRHRPRPGRRPVAVRAVATGGLRDGRA